MAPPHPAEAPKLRPLDVRHFVHEGRPSLLLRDPLQLAEGMLIIPDYFAPLLMLCDGRLPAAALGDTLASRFGLRLSAEVLDYLLTALDDALLLDNGRAATARAEMLARYRAAPFRPPSHAGLSYPAEPAALRHLLDGYLARAGDQPLVRADGPAILSPHIDYQRGGAVYAAAWKRATAMARAAELIVLLGTDHYGGSDDPLTLTRQHYATPYGILPTARPIVDDLADIIGPERAFAGELRHRSEHSLELVAVWLHHLRGGEPVEMVPILTGSFSRFVRGGRSPATDPLFADVLARLREEMARRRLLVVASGDLAHIGPAFGGAPVDGAARARLRGLDDELVARLCAGDGEGFFRAIQREGDTNNVCGLAPFFLALHLVGGAAGQAAAYDQCPADEANTSFVSICGVVLG